MVGPSRKGAVFREGGLFRRGTFLESLSFPAGSGGGGGGPSRKEGVIRDGGVVRWWDRPGKGRCFGKVVCLGGGPSWNSCLFRLGPGGEDGDLPGILWVSGMVIPDIGAETAIPGLPGRGLL